LKFSQKPYFNPGIFLASVKTIPLPYIDTFRGRADVSDSVIRILTEARVRVITFAPHTTQVFQAFDVTLFVFSSRVRGMNCRLMRIMRLAKS
jgi:hypothetical protein